MGLPHVDRKFEYEVLERLLEHMRSDDPREIKLLALHSAETVLGREVPHVRELLKEPPEELQEFPPATDGPGAELRASGELVFTDPSRYFGLKEIGAKAGGYSGVTAGKAADLVAARLGHSRKEIRTVQLPFNKLENRPHPDTGGMMHLYRFNASFANMVVVELRTNPLFLPAVPKDITPFSEGGENFPKLSQGVEVDPPRPPMANIDIERFLTIETL